MRLELALSRGAVTYRQYDYWNRRGWLPWGNPGSGNPRPRDLPAAEASLLIVMGQLVAAGVQPKAAARLAAVLVEGGQARLGDGLIIEMAAA